MADLSRVLRWVVVTGFVVLVIVMVSVVAPYLLRSTHSAPVVVQPELVASDTFMPEAVEELPRVARVPTPAEVKAIYMTACVASTPSWRTSLKALIDSTELNAVVLDIKDSTGIISFRDESLQPNSGIPKGCKVADIKEFIEDLHTSGIYVIGRISVFQDPYYATLHPHLAVKRSSDGSVWKDYKGLSFIDVGAKEYWNYILRISEKSYELGFDELNFDYVRYPSDGNMKDVAYTWTSSTVVSSSDTSSTTSSQVRAMTKPEMLESFFAYLEESLRASKYSDLKTSVDLFGLTTTLESDMGIGQVLERALPYFDYIAPMVYPSHYPSGWNGYVNPAAQPYDVIKAAMTRAVEREMIWREKNGMSTSTPTKMRPWLQDFNLGAVYTPDMIRAQIQATYDSGISSWMLWSAANRYTESALLPQ